MNFICVTPSNEEIYEKRTIAVKYAIFQVREEKPEKKNVLNSWKKWAKAGIEPLLRRLRVHTVWFEDNSNYG